MLHFMRKHQQYFFAIIATVIIISFSFFGTYSTLGQNDYREQMAFRAIDGTEISRQDLDEMAVFLGTDNEDKQLFGGVWGPNFLNDGVIKNDFLKTGMGEILAASYPNEINPDLLNRLEKEKKFVLYTHPQAKFLNVMGAWNYFAPDLKNNFEAIRNASDPSDPEIFSARVKLFLGEKKFPASTLRQVLRYQQKQYSWLTPDPNLDRVDLSLFGYHTLEDWFGPRFTRLVAEFIINSAKIAEKKGYVVTKGEAMADLMRNSEISYRQNANNPNIGVGSGSEYFSEQLRRLGLDQTKAAKLWRQVLLFRRVFHDMGNSVLVDLLSYKKFNEYAKASVEGEVYTLPKELWLGDFRSLQKFETYLSAVSKRAEDGKALLDLPKTYYTVDEIAAKNPELIQKHYVLEISSVSKKSLQNRIGLKETWNWEVEDKNWTLLKKQFPDLGIKPGDSRDDRFTALDSLDEKTRAKVDAFAQSAIVDEHPDWMEKALQGAEVKTVSTGIRLKGQNALISGLSNGEELMVLLDKAPLAGDQLSEKLKNFSADNNNFYRIRVIERKPQKEMLTYAEADKEGILDKLVDRQLQAYYEKTKEGYPKEYQNDAGSWIAYSDVKTNVAEKYYAKILKQIRENYASAFPSEKAPKEISPDIAASLRLYGYVQDVKKQLEKNSSSLKQLFRDVTEGSLSDADTRLDPKDQWKLEKNNYQASRSTGEEELNHVSAFDLTEGKWSSIHSPPNGQIYFFQIKSKSSQEIPLDINKVKEARMALSDDAQRMLMYYFLKEIKDKNGISLDYLSSTPEMTPENGR
jgi:GcvH upstream region-like protein